MITVIALSLMISPLWLSIARRIRDRAAMGLTSLRDMVGTTVPPSVTLPKKIDEMIDQVDKSNDNNKDKDL